MNMYDPAFEGPIEPLDVAKYLRKYWVNCKDRMPPETKRVLVCVTENYDFKDTAYIEDRNEKACVCVNDYYEIEEEKKYVWWMPLPEAPEINDEK